MLLAFPFFGKANIIRKMVYKNILLFIFILIGVIPCSQAQNPSISQIDFEEVSRVVDAPLGSVWNLLPHVAVDSSNSIYVADASNEIIVQMEQHDGTFVREFGGEGQGPGKFGDISSMQVVGGDTLFISDDSNRRITYWPAEDESPDRVTRLEYTGSFDAAIRLTPNRIITTDQMAYRADDAERDDDRQVVVALHGSDGAMEQDSVQTWETDEVVLSRERGIVFVGDHPFGRENKYAVHAERFYRLWTGEPRVTIYDAALQQVGQFALAHDAPPVTSDDVDRAVDAIQEGGVIGDIYRSALREVIPDTWPPVVSMFVDDQGYIWVGLRTPPDEPNRWVQCNENGDIIAEGMLPNQVTLEAIRGNRAYGIAEDPEYGGPITVVYTIRD